MKGNAAASTMPKPITAQHTGSNAGIRNIENAPGYCLRTERGTHNAILVFAETPPRPSFNVWLIMRAPHPSAVHERRS